MGCPDTDANPKDLVLIYILAAFAAGGIQPTPGRFRAIPASHVSGPKQTDWRLGWGVKSLPIFLILPRLLGCAHLRE
jgi:hypothetical protein